MPFDETWDRLTLLLIAVPQEGWEEVYEEITRREVERLSPGHPENPQGRAQLQEENRELRYQVDALRGDLQLLRKTFEDEIGRSPWEGLIGGHAELRARVGARQE